MMEMSDEEDATIACNVELVQIAANHMNTAEKKNRISELLTQNADINFRDGNRELNTALHLAARKNDEILVEYLLQVGANCEIVNQNGETPIVLSRNENIITMLTSALHDKKRSHLLPRNEHVHTSAQEKIVEISQARNEEYRDIQNIETFTTTLDAGELDWSLLDTAHIQRSNFRVLKLNNCKNFQHALSIMEDHRFMCAFNDATHLFLIIFDLISYSDLSAISRVELSSEKPVIIQLSCSMRHQIAYRYPKCTSFTFVENVQKIDEDLLICSKFDFPLLLRALASNLGGCFDGDLMRCSIDVSREFDGWRFIDYAARYDDCLSILLLMVLAKWEVAKMNSSKMRLLEIAAQFGRAPSICAILELPIILPELEIRLSDHQRVLTEMTDENNKTPLIIAAASGTAEALILFIRLQCGASCFLESAINAAWTHEKYHHVEILLEANAPFPLRFCESEDNDRFKQLVDDRNDFHDAIRNKDMNGVEKFISNYPLIKTGFCVKNKSALETCLEAGSYNVFALLQCYGFRRDKRVMDLLSNLQAEQNNALKQTYLKYFPKEKNSHLVYLISNTRLALGQNDVKLFDRAREFYLMLDNIPQVSLVLRVVAESGKVVIVFDFQCETIFNLDHSIGPNNTKGLCNYKSGVLYISAKQEDKGSVNDILGTLAHELTHLAMQVRFDNDCNPYHRLDDERSAQFIDIVARLEERQDVDIVITRVYSNKYDSEARPSELVVRVPQILAQYPHQLAYQKLSNVHALFEWYEKNIDIEFQRFLDNPRYFQSMIHISRINNLTGVLSHLIETCSKIALLDSRCLYYIFDKKFPIFLVTNFSKLSLLNLFQTLKMKTMTLVAISSRVIFSRAQQYRNVDLLKDVVFSMHTDVDPHLIIDCTDASHSDIATVLSMAKEIVSKKNMIIIFNDRQLDIYRNCEQLFQELKVIRDTEYFWGDLSCLAQQQLLQKQVYFQNLPIQLSQLITASSHIAHTLPLTELIASQEPMRFGGPLTLHSEYDPDLYINRSFRHVRDNSSKEDVHFINLLGSCSSDRIILLSDIAGMGKTIAVSHISRLMKNKYRHYWIVPIELNDHTDILKKYKDLQFAEPYDSVNFLTFKLLKLSHPFEIALFQQCFAEVSLVKLVLLFDGFDEISPVYKELVLDLLTQLKKTCVRQIWVTTRPHLIKELEDRLEADHFELEPFLESNQIDFLQKFWTKELKLDVSSIPPIVHVFSRRLVQKISQSLDDNNQTLIGMPLQTRLLADLYKEQLKTMIETNTTTIALPETLDISQIFQSFIENKYEIFQNEKGRCSTSNLVILDQGSVYFQFIMKSHHMLALQVIFGKRIASELTGRTYHLPIEQISRVGLVTVEDVRVSFVNRTFAEFFAAQYCVVQMGKRGETCLHVQELFLNQIFVLEQHKIIRSFLDGLVRARPVTIAKSMTSPKWQILIAIDPKMFIVKTLVREGHCQLLHLTFDILLCLDCHDIIKSIVSCHELWSKAAASGNAQILKMLRNQTKCLETNIPFEIVLITASLNNQLLVLELVLNWCKESNVDVKKMLWRIWRNGCGGGHVSVLEWVYTTYIEHHLSDFQKLVSDVSCWEYAAENGCLTVLNHLKNLIENNANNAENEIVCFTSQELTAILLDSYVWSNAVNYNHLSVLQTVWQWCGEMNLNNTQLKLLLLNNHAWWNAISKNNVDMVKMFINWSTEIGVTAIERKNILLDAEVWDGSREIREMMWQWMISEMNQDEWLPTADEFKLLFANILNGAREMDDIFDRLVLFRTDLSTNEMINLLKDVWRDAAYSNKLSSLETVWKYMKTSKLDSVEINELLLDVQVWREVAKEGFLEIEEKLWEYCQDRFLTLAQFQQVLLEVWRGAAIGNQTITLCYLWRFLTQPKNFHDDQLKVASDELSDDVVDDYWWQEIFPTKKDVIGELMDWAENMNCLDTICRVLCVGSFVGTEKLNDQLFQKMMADVHIETNEIGFKDRFIREWREVGDTAQSLALEALQKWWTSPMTNLATIKQNSKEERLNQFRRKRQDIQVLIDKINQHKGSTNNLSVIKMFLLDNLVWEYASFHGHTAVLQHLTDWRTQASLPVCNEKETTIFMLQGAAGNGRIQLFTQLAASAKHLNVSDEELKMICWNGLNQIAVNRNSTALTHFLVFSVDNFYLNHDKLTEFVTDILLWRNAAKHGDVNVIDVLVLIALRYKVEIDKISVPLLDEQVWLLGAEAGWPTFFKGLLNLFTAAGLDPKSVGQTLLLNAWDRAIRSANPLVLESIWIWAKTCQLHFQEFFQIFHEWAINSYARDDAQIREVKEALKELWKFDQLEDVHKGFLFI